MYSESVEASKRGEHIPQYVSASDLNRAGVSTKTEYFQHQLEHSQARASAVASLPWPADYCDESMPKAERERVASLLDSGRDVGGYCGSSWDRLSEDPSKSMNGSRERSAGGYVWPSGLSTYVRKYGLVIAPEILQAIEADV